MDMKRILITAGGTSEKMDQVRSITNHSTGKLGYLIATKALEQGIQVDYITTLSASKPITQENLQIYLIEDTQQLATQLTHLLETNSYDAVIHSMAVSDFTPVTSYSIEAFTAALNHQLAQTNLPVTTEQLVQLIEKSEATNTSKISSNTDYLFLTLKKNPKVIQLIKQIQPQTMLVSFKLLVDVSKEELFNVAMTSMKKNNGDFVLANDLQSIQGDQHLGYLLDHKGNLVGEATTKEQIASLILTALNTKGVE